MQLEARVKKVQVLSRKCARPWRAAAHARIRIHSMNSECQEIECQEFQIVRCECQEILLRKAFKWHPLNASVEPWDGVRRAPPPMGRAAIEPFFPNVAIGVRLHCQEIAVSRVSRAEGDEDGAQIGAVAVENEKTEDSGLLTMNRRLAHKTCVAINSTSS